MTKKNKAALYVRVSTKDKQETKNQIQDLKEYWVRPNKGTGSPTGIGALI